MLSLITCSECNLYVTLMLIFYGHLKIINFSHSCFYDILLQRCTNYLNFVAFSFTAFPRNVFYWVYFIRDHSPEVGRRSI